MFLIRNIILSTEGIKHFSVSQPSVYDVAGSQLVLEAIFDDGEKRTFKVWYSLCIKEQGTF